MSVASVLGFSNLPAELQAVLVAVETELLTQVNASLSTTESNVRQIASDTLAQLTALVKSIPLAGMSEIDVDLTLSVGGVAIPLKGSIKLRP